MFVSIIYSTLILFLFLEILVLSIYIKQNKVINNYYIYFMISINLIYYYRYRCLCIYITISDLLKPYNNNFIIYDFN